MPSHFGLTLQLLKKERKFGAEGLACSPSNIVSFIERWASSNAPPLAVTATRDGEEVKHETQTSPIVDFSLHKVDPHSLP